MFSPGNIMERAKSVATKRNADAAGVISRIECIDWFPGYSEPGYEVEKKGAGVYAANWNEIGTDNTMPRLSAIFEHMGAGVEWSDEWAGCAECGRAVRTKPDSYGWQPSYFMTEDGEICHGCVSKEHRKEYRENCPEYPTKIVCKRVPLDA